MPSESRIHSTKLAHKYLGERCREFEDQRATSPFGVKPRETSRRVSRRRSGSHGFNPEISISYVKPNSQQIGITGGFREFFPQQ
jgi:hypothetical protein